MWADQQGVEQSARCTPPAPDAPQEAPRRRPREALWPRPNQGSQWAGKSKTGRHSLRRFQSILPSSAGPLVTSTRTRRPCHEVFRALWTANYTDDRKEPRHPNHFIDPEMPGSTKKRRYSPPRTSAQTHKSVRLKAAAHLNLGAARAIQQSMQPPLQQQARRQAESETVDS